MIVGFDRYVAHLAVEILALRGWLSTSAGFNTSPQNTLTNFWGVLRADVRERFEATRHPMLDLLRCCWNWWWNQWLGFVGLAPLGPRSTAGLLKTRGRSASASKVGGAMATPSFAVFPSPLRPKPGTNTDELLGSAGARKVEGTGTADGGGKVVESTSTPGRTYPQAFDVNTATAQTLSWTHPRADPKMGAVCKSKTGPPNDVPPQLGDIVQGA